MGFVNIFLRPCHTDVQRFAYGLIARAVAADVCHPVVFLVFRNAIAAAPRPVDERRETAALVHVPATVLKTKVASDCRPVQQVITLSEPCLVAAAVGAILAVVAYVGHQPFVTFAENGGTVELMEIVCWRHYEAVFIRCTYFVVDGLHHRLRDGICLGGQADEHQDGYGDLFHDCLSLEEPVHFVAAP